MQDQIKFQHLLKINFVDHQEKANKKFHDACQEESWHCRCYLDGSEEHDAFLVGKTFKREEETNEQGITTYFYQGIYSAEE